MPAENVNGASSSSHSARNSRPSWSFEFAPAQPVLAESSNPWFRVVVLFNGYTVYSEHCELRQPAAMNRAHSDNTSNLKTNIGSGAHSSLCYGTPCELSSTSTVFDQIVVTARSTRPSPFKSPTAIDSASIG